MNKKASQIDLFQQAAERSDADLVRAACGGDKKAFVEIVARHQGMVAGVTLAILQNFQASEDAAQEAFITAWKKIGDLREPEKLKPWLSHIARNAALMSRRKQRPSESFHSAMTVVEDDKLRPDAVAVNEEEKVMVIAALEDLPENYRLPLVLFYREEHSIKAVAETLDLSEDVVKKRLSRGREMLRQRVSGLIDTVLGETLPSAVFTATVAVAIGALAKPSAIAATVFSAAAATTSKSATTTVAAASTTSTTMTSTVPVVTATTMTTSQFTLTAAALITAVCLPVGYTARLALESDDSAAESMPSSPISAATSSDEAEVSIPLPDSALILEWKRLRQEHGEGVEGLESLFEEVQGMKNPMKHRALMSVLIAEWVRLDPEKGMAFFRAKGRAGWQRDLFVEEWLKRDPSAAVNGLMASGPGWEGIAKQFLLQIAESTPSSLAEIAKRVPPPRSSWDKRVRDAFEVFAAKSPEEARLAAEGMTGVQREQALSGVAMAWAQQDGAAALKWAESFGEKDERNAVVAAVLFGWAKVNPAAALDRLGLVPPGGSSSSSSNISNKVLKVAGAADFEATVQWLRDNPGKISRTTGLADEVGKRLMADPSGFLSGIHADGTLDLLLGALTRSMLNDTSVIRSEIWDWSLKAEKSEGLDILQRHLLTGVGWQEPKSAMKLLDAMEPSAERDKMMSSAARHIIGSGKGMKQFEDLMDGASPEWQANLVKSGFDRLPYTESVDIEIWKGRLGFLSPEDRAKGVERLAQTWAQTDPDSSLEWARSLEDSGEQSKGVESVVAQWAADDSGDAEAWVETLSTGQERDAAAAGLVKANAASNPNEAWSWMQNIESTEKRYEAVRTILMPMAGQDLSTALEWLSGSSLTQLQKEQISGALEKRAQQAPQVHFATEG